LLEAALAGIPEAIDRPSTVIFQSEASLGIAESTSALALRSPTDRHSAYGLRSGAPTTPRGGSDLPPIAPRN
jgi:hypothetical protein